MTAAAAVLPGVVQNRGMITASVMLATLMQSLDTTIANVALPYIQGSVSATSDQITWVLTSYIVAAAIMTPLTGWLEARLGRRRLFLTAVTGFVAASMLCGAATTLPQIVGFRLLQGVFGAPLVPLSQSVLLGNYPPEGRGRAMAIFGIGVMIGPIIGPALGGYLTDAYSWRWVFYVNLPFGILAFLGLLTFLPPDDPDRATPGLDWFGFAALSLGVASLQLFMDRGQQLDWFASREIAWELALCCLGFYAFAVRTVTAENPFVPPRLFTDRNFVVGLVLIFIVGAVLLATLSLLSAYLETLMGFPVMTAGLVLAPRGIGTMAAMALVGRLVGVVDTRILVSIGLGFTGYALLDMTAFTPSISQGAIIWTGLIQGLGLGFVFVPLSTVAFDTLRPEDRTQGTALFSLLRNLGSSIGLSAITVYLTDATVLAHARLVEHLSPYSRAVQDYAPLLRLDTLAGRARVGAETTAQAAAIAYTDAFYLMMLMCFAAIPLTLLFRVRRGRGGGAVAGMD
ncbi:DHA2 family efflux MFS transporter permease subunit [Salinarimonas soli]|uniref:DHA2 family efflux MFS transporter permease subunit n=1 Tax=Salinarimonas soli TaxID=1638099 RepID=A0A5B2VDM1_9HYPH|nr:DHA2 family efflux MFS transporter permease subunit [Salinarimonas soli]KAA2236570.1 DHA2 family efflux MFS transporter permease subunit [Salinarimonas soli]